MISVIIDDCEGAGSFKMPSHKVSTPIDNHSDNDFVKSDSDSDCEGSD